MKKTPDVIYVRSPRDRLTEKKLEDQRAACEKVAKRKGFKIINEK